MAKSRRDRRLGCWRCGGRVDSESGKGVRLAAVQSRASQTVQSGLLPFSLAPYTPSSLSSGSTVHSSLLAGARNDTGFEHPWIPLEFYTGVYTRNSTPKVPPCPTIAFEVPTDCKTRFDNHPSKVSLAWEASNRLYEVLVRRAVARKDGAQ